MPPKKKDAKQEKGQQKALEKQKQKIAEDKTFGLKNKNKSKAVQKYIKGVQQQAKGPIKGGEAQLAKAAQAEKEEKKRTLQQSMLLASIFKGSENIKKIVEPVKVAYDPKASKLEQKINLYEDPRDKKNLDGYNADANRTSIVCKFFLEAVEKKQYGWMWNCPNGDNCQYRHCLPEGYILKDDADESDDEEKEETIEDVIEKERSLLSSGGTPVTLESFTAWRKRKEEARLQAVEEARLSEAKRTGTKGLHVLSGKDLFTYDPSLFVDDEGAAGNKDYEEEEGFWEAEIARNQKTIDDANREALEKRGAESNEDESESEEKGTCKEEETEIENSEESEKNRADTTAGSAPITQDDAIARKDTKDDEADDFSASSLKRMPAEDDEDCLDEPRQAVPIRKHIFAEEDIPDDFLDTLED